MADDDIVSIFSFAFHGDTIEDGVTLVAYRDDTDVNDPNAMATCWFLTTEEALRLDGLIAEILAARLVDHMVENEIPDP